VNLTLTRHLLGRMLRGKRLLGAIALASVAGVAAWISMAGEPANAAWDEYQVVVSTVPAATLSISLLILGTAALRDERDEGTLPFVFLTPMSAITFAVSAWVAAAVGSLFVAVIGWIPGWIGSGIITGSWGGALPALSLYVGAAVGYSAIFVPLGYLFSRSLLVGLGYVFVWEGILANAVPGLGASSVWRLCMSVYADLDDLTRDALDVLGTVEPGRWGGIATLAGLALAGLATLTWAVRTRDAV
jgi:ABC-2 type transport system permease protein